MPNSEAEILGGIARRFRGLCAKGFLIDCGKNVNIQMGAMVDPDICIGNRSGIGAVKSLLSG